MMAVQRRSFFEEQSRERKSGWSEEAILKSLKTRNYKVSQEAEICSICMKSCASLDIPTGILGDSPPKPILSRKSSKLSPGLILKVDCSHNISTTTHPRAHISQQRPSYALAIASGDIYRVSREGSHRAPSVPGVVIDVAASRAHPTYISGPYTSAFDRNKGEEIA
ncbi:hypothetical protein Syun_008725 [Stephania yunnanensis]|uniref:Uncharacterized protein n=1 Tax=Stephania yunnanensis TaxID=152371 RepID=A0AAP0PRM2_9MAGN